MDTTSTIAAHDQISWSPDDGSAQAVLELSIAEGDPRVSMLPLEIWPDLPRAMTVVVDLTGLALADSRTISWLLELRAHLATRIVVRAPRRIEAALRMLGLSKLFRIESVDVPNRSGGRS
ncbi:MAG: hypothetical protein H0W83_14155 [Planctomycetes bacterium]|nr:hypothetical protein [Planctomycetota bacterium]